ncbi:MAG: hypothetical protein AAGG38_00250 [Planctomycetota bacterium]
MVSSHPPPTAKARHRVVSHVLGGVSVGLTIGVAAWLLPLASSPVPAEGIGSETAAPAEADETDRELAWSYRRLRGPLSYPEPEAEPADDPPEAVVETPPIETAAPWPAVTLIGISQRSSGKVLGFFRGQDGSVEVLGEGESIDGVLIRRLEADHAVVEFGDESRQVPIKPAPVGMTADTFPPIRAARCGVSRNGGPAHV